MRARQSKPKPFRDWIPGWYIALTVVSMLIVTLFIAYKLLIQPPELSRPHGQHRARRHKHPRAVRHPDGGARGRTGGSARSKGQLFYLSPVRRGQGRGQYRHHHDRRVRHSEAGAFRCQYPKGYHDPFGPQQQKDQRHLCPRRRFRPGKLLRGHVGLPG